MLVLGVDVPYQSGDEQCGEERTRQQAVVEEVGQRVGELVGVSEEGWSKDRTDHREFDEPGDAADDGPNGYRRGVARSRDAPDVIVWLDRSGASYAQRYRLPTHIHHAHIPMPCRPWPIGTSDQDCPYPGGHLSHCGRRGGRRGAARHAGAGSVRTSVPGVAVVVLPGVAKISGEPNAAVLV